MTSESDVYIRQILTLSKVGPRARSYIIKEREWKAKVTVE